jgi:protein-tyrosine phosphatase
MDWITDQIAIGNTRDSEALPPDVTAVLCLMPGCSCGERTDVDACQVPMIDGKGNGPTRLIKAVAFVHDVVSDGGHVLVPRHAGRSRSVVIGAGYLMDAHHLSAKAALAMIAAKREIWVTEGLSELLRSTRGI